jgi:hypothetical protein
VRPAASAQARLKVLDLSENALGEKGVRACAAALSGQARSLAGSCRPSAQALGWQRRLVLRGRHVSCAPWAQTAALVLVMSRM